MRLKLSKSVFQLLIATISVFMVLMSPVMAANEVVVSRNISIDNVQAGGSFTVTIDLKTNEELVTMGLQEIVPEGWLLKEHDSGSFTFSPSTNGWLWSDFTNNVESGNVSTIIYDVEVPEIAESGIFTINGNIIGKKLPEYGGETIVIPIEGISEITVLGKESSFTQNTFSGGNSNSTSINRSSVELSQGNSSIHDSIDPINSSSNINYDVTDGEVSKTDAISEERISVDPTKNSSLDSSSLLIIVSIVVTALGLIVFIKKKGM